jgi:hypothetical protein
MTDQEPTSRICREVQAHLPGYVDQTLPRWRRRLVRAHLRRCQDCSAELQRQESVVAGLEDLETAAAASVELPPEGLLNDLLGLTDKPSVIARAAVPARGAVSGARPGLSVALLVVGATAGTAAGYAAWCAARAVQRRFDRS